MDTTDQDKHVECTRPHGIGIDFELLLEQFMESLDLLVYSMHNVFCDLTWAFLKVHTPGL
jgi:hypothetical protein